MHVLMYFLFLLSSMSTAYAQLYLNASCNFTELITSTTFDISKIAGAWYQLERIENTFEAGDCSTATFTATLSSSGTATGLDFSSREVCGGELVYRNASVTLSTSYLGVLNFTFSDGNSYEYVIIPVTPYEHESMVLYSCQNNWNSSSVWSWKLGKNLSQSPQAKNATEKIISGMKDVFNATWRITSFSEADCKINRGVNLHTIPLFMALMISLCSVIK